jgi:hypothetical protein
MDSDTDMDRHTDTDHFNRQLTKENKNIEIIKFDKCTKSNLSADALL